MVNNSTLFKNESSSDYFEIQENAHPENVAIVYCALNVPLMLMSIVENALVMVTILRTPSLSSPSTTLLCNLALTDLLIGLVVQPLFITKELKNNHSLIWNRLIYLIVASGFIVACLLTSSFCYIRIFQIVRRHQMQIHAQQQVTQNSEATDNLNITKLKKSTINTFVFYTFLLLCYVPLFIFLALLGIVKMEWQKGWNFAATLVFMISSINPFLYCWRLSKLRRAVLKTARKMLCTKTE